MPLPKAIQNTEDIRTFFVCLTQEESLNFHPDTPFDKYICYTTQMLL